MIRILATCLRKEGFVVTSRWLEESEDPPFVLAEDPDGATERAVRDTEDILASDDLVVWKPRESHRDTTGAHHAETGAAIILAITRGMGVYVLGVPENVFHYHPVVRRCRDANELFEHLRSSVHAPNG